MFVPYQEYKYPNSFKEPQFAKKPYISKFEPNSYYERKPVSDPNAYRPGFQTFTKKAHNWNPNYEKYAHILPIPKGSTAYAQAKRSEYVEKDLMKAELYYRMAIDCGERVESAIKDLATVLHQQGRTEEACKFLEDHSHLCEKNQGKFENLLTNLKKQIVPSGNYGNRILIVFNVPLSFDEAKVKYLFGNSSRINLIQFKENHEVDSMIRDYYGDDKPVITLKRIALIHFPSNSAARKTLESVRDPTIQFYWMNLEGQLGGKAESFKKVKDPRSSKSHGSENELATYPNLSTKDNSPQSSGGPAATHFPIVSSRKDSLSCSSPCWKNLVFPSLPKDGEDGQSSAVLEEFSLGESIWENKSSEHTKPLLWKQMNYKLKETKSMISNDPDFVKKLLHKVLDDFNSKAATSHYSDSNSLRYKRNERVLMT